MTPIDDLSATQLDRMELQFDVVEKAAVGCTVKCPRCNTRFTKRTRFHLFDNPDCKYEYQRIIQQEIQQA